MATIAWSLLSQLVDATEELERYTFGIDSAARTNGTLPDIPEGLTAQITKALSDARLALAVARELRS